MARVVELRSNEQEESQCVTLIRDILSSVVQTLPCTATPGKEDREIVIWNECHASVVLEMPEARTFPDLPP